MARRFHWAQRSRFDILRIALSIGVVGFICAATYIGSILLDRQQALDPLGRGNITWLIAQTPTEYARLEQRISAYAMGFDGVDAQEVQLRYDIIVNRVSTLRSEFLTPFITSSARNQETLAEFERVVEAARPLIAELEVAGTPTELLELLAPVYPDLVRLSVDANTWNAARIDSEREDLFRLQTVFAWAAAGLVVCGLMFVVLLVLNNRLLARTQKALETQNNRFEAALNNISQALCLTDADQKLLVCNGRFLEVFGLDEAQIAKGEYLADFVPNALLPDAFGHQRGGAEISLNDTKTQVRAYTQSLDDGTTVYVSHRAMIGGGWVSTFEDITERQRAQDRIAHMAHHDALTDLPNRFMFWEKTTDALGDTAANNRSFAVLYLDLDRFKDVNDTLGHSVGDRLLQSVAERLTQAATPSNLVGRLGGDEFAVLHVPEHNQPLDVSALAERLLETVRQPYLVYGKEITLTTSIGYAFAPADGATTEDLIKKADLALYRAKKEGANTYRRFDPEMEQNLRRKRGLETDLTKAIALNQFQIHYQPLIDLATMTITAGEALLRWNHPVHGPISPAEFISLAEETGYIDTLGQWVLRQAFDHATQWPNDVRVSVNLSPLQFKDAMIYERIETALFASGLRADRVEIEITESVLLADNRANYETLRRLRALGLSIVLDDFGTGYSSLNYLLDFPFDKIKIDQRFVRDLPGRDDSFAIVQSIASLAKRLKMTTTAEGVETSDQLNCVIEAGCSQAQGYYLGRPVPEPKFLSLLYAETRHSVTHTHG